MDKVCWTPIGAFYAIISLAFLAALCVIGLVLTSGKDDTESDKLKGMSKKEVESDGESDCS